jgi:hypothetical protein
VAPADVVLPTFVPSARRNIGARSTVACATVNVRKTGRAFVLLALR